MVEPVGSFRSAGSQAEIAAGQAEDAMKAEISALRAEIASIRDSLTKFGGDAYENVSRSASQAATYVQEEATSVAGAIREHPATATTLMTLIGAIGFALGYVVASAQAEHKDAWYRRYY